MIRLVREVYLGDCTLGRMFFAGREVYTLEQEWRDNTTGNSCIPEGDYVLRHHSGPQQRHAWQLMDVPGRTWILIHPGNTEVDTEGCILVGMRRTIRVGLEGTPDSAGVWSSRKAMTLLSEYIVAQDTPWIRIESMRSTLPPLES